MKLRWLILVPFCLVCHTVGAAVGFVLVPFAGFFEGVKDGYNWGCEQLGKHL